MQKTTFFLKKKWFIKLTFRWLQTGRLEKQQTIEILLMVDCLRIFKNVAFFKIFRDFSKFTSNIGKIVNCT